MNANNMKQCANCKRDFQIATEDFAFYDKMSAKGGSTSGGKVPAPTLCPECRVRRRMTWRNERSLYKRKCDAPGHSEEIISMYDPKRGYVAYDVEYWWSDAWDAMDFGIEYDSTKPFFLQFSELLKRVPMPALSRLNSPNCEYTNFVELNKNCYLIFGSGLNENVCYANKVINCKDSMDMLMCSKCELCYECVGCAESYRLLFSRNSKSCTDSAFLYNCRNCNNCFGCANLTNKSYCLYNKQYTKEGYYGELKKQGIETPEGLAAVREKFEREIYSKAIHRHANIFASQNCTGDDITNAKNAINCFDIYEDVEDSKYLYSALNSKDCYDSNGLYKAELVYESIDSNESSGNVATQTVYNSHDVAYSIFCHSCSDCFGCVGLRKKQYCILNKQYTPKEYKQQISQIKEQMKREGSWGEFFPSEISPFAYHETIAQEYFPKPMPPREKRDHKIGGDVVECEHRGECDQMCTEALRIIPREKEFHAKIGVPAPTLCPNCRHFERLKLRNPMKLWHRKCMRPGCKNGFETSYSPERLEIVYCEKCYQAEVL